MHVHAESNFLSVAHGPSVRPESCKYKGLPFSKLYGALLFSKQSVRRPAIAFIKAMAGTSRGLAITREQIASLSAPYLPVLNLFDPRLTFGAGNSLLTITFRTRANSSVTLARGTRDSTLCTVPAQNYVSGSTTSRTVAGANPDILARQVPNHSIVCAAAPAGTARPIPMAVTLGTNNRAGQLAFCTHHKSRGQPAASGALHALYGP